MRYLLYCCLHYAVSSLSCLSLCRAAEVPDVPLAELLHRNLVTFLRTGRYTPCAEVARSYDYAQQRVYNAVGQLTSAEDFAFDAGTVPTVYIAHAMHLLDGS